MSIREKINTLIKVIKPTVNLEGVEDIIDSGYLDSLELMGLITGIMEEFNVEIELDLITPENFNSIEAITKMVEGIIK